MPQVQSLPTVPPESFNTSDKIQEIGSAYSMTLLFEHAASSNIDPQIRERKLIHARVLGHLREAPSMHATQNVANQTPPVWPSVETKRELIEYKLRTNGDQSQCSEEAQKRVFSRLLFVTISECMVTGKYNYRSLEWSTEIMQEVTDSDVATSLTECLHIFPQSIARISGVDAKDVKILSTSWLEWHSRSRECHDLTVDASLRIFFETLLIWFEAIDDQDNTYAIRAKHNGMLRLCRDNPITLTSQHADLPLPNRRFSITWRKWEF
ncbi:hypothetical protein BGY98DRAFT_1113164 [Russula aff. rugulosa BPL654]|nr:hypothetical protein BGY98DRAFT_1113164 [Russula aff. rugulosa BPL654]